MTFHVIESALGHRFISADSPDEDQCLTCGGVWQLVDRGDGTGRYLSNNGADAQPCSHRTDLEHGYERYCQTEGGRPCPQNDDRGTCPHVEHACNCLLCD